MTLRGWRWVNGLTLLVDLLWLRRPILTSNAWGAAASFMSSITDVMWEEISESAAQAKWPGGNGGLNSAPEWKMSQACLRERRSRVRLSSVCVRC